MTVYGNKTGDRDQNTMSNESPKTHNKKIEQTLPEIHVDPQPPKEVSFCDDAYLAADLFLENCFEICL